MSKRFNHQRWEELLLSTVASIRSLSEVKGGEYAGDDDRLANFRRNAASLDLTMEQVWRVYAGKHWDSISQWIKDRSNGTVRTRSELMLGRADDLIVYCILLKAMMLEVEDADRPIEKTLHLPATQQTLCDHQWHKFDRYTDTCVFCNSMRPHRGRGV